MRSVGCRGRSLHRAGRGGLRRSGRSLDSVPDLAGCLTSQRLFDVDNSAAGDTGVASTSTHALIAARGTRSVGGRRVVGLVLEEDERSLDQPDVPS